MIQLEAIGNLCLEDKKFLLKQLEYDTDGEYVFKDGTKVVDKYTNMPVKIDNMLIFQGSVEVLDNNPLSIISYLEDHPEYSFID